MIARTIFTALISLFSTASLIACGGGSDAADTTPEGGSMTTPTVGATLTNADGWPRVEGLRGDKYCEVLLASAVDGHLVAEVWNSYGLNECPAEQWAALDAAEIKAAHEGVLFALLNGPRYWLMDAIEKKPAGPRETETFGEIKMFLAATVDLGPIPPNLAPYTERTVARETVFEFAAGQEVYQLTDGLGRVFIMQSYSQQSDPGLTEDALAQPGASIFPPPGWTFTSRTLDDTLRVLAPNNEAVVVQDPLGNTYQLIAD
jgi:hypothetical protein